jgi:predicted AAA+ superfamily ATPase
LLQVANLRDYERFLRACALRTGQLLNRADLARDIGISGSTAGAWLSVLQASGQIVLLEPWFSNRTKALVKTPKIYLADTGLCAFLTGLRSIRDLIQAPMAGALWETLVFSEIRRLHINRRGGWSLNFWRDRSKEVDFLVHQGGRFHLGEAKWTEQPSQQDADGLMRVTAELPADTVVSREIVCRCANAFPLPGLATVLPLADLAKSALVGPSD